MGQKGACDRLSHILGLFPSKGETQEKAQERRETAAKVQPLSSQMPLFFRNSLHQAMAELPHFGNSKKRKTRSERQLNIGSGFGKTSTTSLIFELGERVLNELPINANSTIATRALLTEAISICSQQAALRHDLMGRIYHWLLHHAKYLGNYHTSVSAATLLLKLTLAAKWKQDFSDPVELASFKVADLACGTGTLLMARAQALSDVYIRERAGRDLPLDVKDMSTLHRALDGKRLARLRRSSLCRSSHRIDTSQARPGSRLLFEWHYSSCPLD